MRKLRKTQAVAPTLCEDQKNDNNNIFNEVS